MAPRLTLIGPPGSGKGTQGQLLRELGYLHVSSGDMLRAEIAAATPRGRAIAEIVVRGALVDDAVMFGVVDGFLSSHQGYPVVLDGYPRSLEQARHLDAAGISAAIFFTIADELLLRRIRDRVLGGDGRIYDLSLRPPPPGLAVSRRADDSEVTLRHRLRIYRALEAGLWDYYDRNRRAHALDASRGVKDVHAELLATLRRLGLHTTAPVAAPFAPRAPGGR